MPDIVYRAALPVHVTRRSTGMRQIHTITAEVGLQSTSSASKKDLLLRLTDDTDPFFLFSLDLSEDDFLTLKRAQDLKVDFTSFPSSLVALFDRCVAEAKSDSPKFMLELELAADERTPAAFSVVETNPFKNLTHLSLRCAPGSDATLKAYLASCLKGIRDERNTLATQLERVRSDAALRAQHAEEQLRQRSEECAALRAQIAAVTEQARVELDRNVTVVRERAMLGQQQMQDRHIQEMQDRQEKAAAQIAMLERRLTEASQSAAVTTERLHRAELSERELSGRLAATETALATARATMAALEGENHRLADERRQLQHVSDERARELAMASGQLQRATTELDVKSRQATSDAADRARMEETVAQLRSRAQALEEALRASAQEINKGNTIIQHLQGEVRALKTKVKARNDVTVTQEARINALESELAQARKDLNGLEQRAAAGDGEAARVRTALEATRLQLDERTRQLRETENVVLYLQKQVDAARPGGEDGRAPLAALTASDVNARQVLFRPKAKPAEQGRVSPLDPKYLPAESSDQPRPRSRLPQPAPKAASPPQHPPAPSTGHGPAGGAQPAPQVSGPAVHAANGASVVPPAIPLLAGLGSRSTLRTDTQAGSSRADLAAHAAYRAMLTS